jgi:hypothetical protein
VPSSHRLAAGFDACSNGCNVALVRALQEAHCKKNAESNLTANGAHPFPRRGARRSVETN